MKSRNIRRFVMTKSKKFLVVIMALLAAICIFAFSACTTHEHEWDEGTLTKEATCTEEGEKTYTCTICGKTKTETIEATGHTPSSTWSSGETTHWHTCIICNAVMDEASHNFENGVCSVCGYAEGGSGSGSGSTTTDKTEPTENTKVYMVGDSTMCSFQDAYYLPRYGYGTQVANYLYSEATVNNLALSGRSSLSFLSESNYTTLTSNITSGDYLIIGFGHNDEKSDDATRYTDPATNAIETEGSFQNILYEKYIKIAEDAGATPILCTPIARYNSSGTYTGSSGHITSDGNYPEAIRELGEKKNVTVIDLTALTIADYTELGTDAQWYHAHTSARLATDGDDSRFIREVTTDTAGTTQQLYPQGIDTTHLNMYGAKMVAYEFATALDQTNIGLADYVKSGISKPTIADDFESAYNPDYVYAPYTAPDLINETPLATTGENVSWYGTAFGDIGTSSPSSKGYVYTYDSSASSFSVGQSNTSNAGKIASSSEGIAMIFTQLDANQQFSISATFTIDQANSTSTSDTAAVNQSGFGIMLRDDMYLNANDSSILSNYVASGMYMSGEATTQIIYSRVATTITPSGNSISSAYKVGDTVTITLQRSGGGQNTTCTVVYGGQTYTYTYYDFDYVEKDYEYSYLGFYATRGTVVTVSNISLTIGEIGQA